MLRHTTTDHTSRCHKLILVACIVLSLAVHSLAGIVIERFGPHEFGPPITEPAVTMVELNRPPVVRQPARPPQAATAVAAKPAVVATTAPASSPKGSDASPATTEDHVLHQPTQPKQITVPQPKSEYLRADTIVPVQQERLVYQISLMGMPVGSAQLEATNQQGELRIRTSVSSNSVISAIYPVHNRTDTRLIKGRYLLTRIRQHEGSFTSDTGFNLMYPEQKIFWVDRIKNQFSNEPLEALDTLDFVSGFYFLRQQPLTTGDRLTLRLYDGATTTQVPVAVLRHEQLALPGLRSAATVVVQPQFAHSGFFKNNRDLLVWFTDDQQHVPVRIEATTPIGRVVAELVSSERTLVAPPANPASTVVPDTKMQYN